MSNNGFYDGLMTEQCSEYITVEKSKCGVFNDLGTEEVTVRSAGSHIKESMTKPELAISWTS